MEGRCHQCGKSYQQKMFRDKEVIAITCSWCKKSYHNKRSCFSSACFEEKCDRGALREMMLPPSWMLRLSNNRKRHASKNGCSTKGSMGGKGVVIASLPTKKQKRKYRPFVVKSMDQSIIGPTQPLLVFVNPSLVETKALKLYTHCVGC
uniref:Uncharacterized protein n=1 Tax=Ditylenchus dipsaci TaxID=166011 RepID=A0A915EPA7_9BILA